MEIPKWFFAGLLILLTILVFLRCQRNLSYFASPRVPFTGTNTLFNMNEMDWIPNEIKSLLKDRINVDVVPAFKAMSQRSWDSMSASEKASVLEKLDDFFKRLVEEMNKSNVQVTTTA